MIDVRDGGIRGNHGKPVGMDETCTIPSGSASVFEATSPEAGIYIGLDHNMNHVLRGAAFAVVATPDATDNDQPAGLWVPYKVSLHESAMTTEGQALLLSFCFKISKRL